MYAIKTNDNQMKTFKTYESLRFALLQLFNNDNELKEILVYSETLGSWFPDYRVIATSQYIKMYDYYTNNYVDRITRNTTETTTTETTTKTIKNSNIKTLTLKQVRDMFELDSILRKANKSANLPIIKLIDIINNDNAVITCEVASLSSTILNRGSVVECLIKILMCGYQKTKKYAQNRHDLTLSKGDYYEVKYSSSKGYASYSKPIKDKLIFVNQYGVYLTSGDNIVFDKCGKHIKDIDLRKPHQVLLTF